MTQLWSLANVAPMSSMDHGETLAKDLKTKIFTFCIKLGVLLDLRNFIPYTTKFQDPKPIKISIWTWKFTYTFKSKCDFVDQIWRT